MTLAHQRAVHLSLFFIELSVFCQSTGHLNDRIALPAE